MKQIGSYSGHLLSRLLNAYIDIIIMLQRNIIQLPLVQPLLILQSCNAKKEANWLPLGSFTVWASKSLYYATTQNKSTSICSTFIIFFSVATPKTKQIGSHYGHLLSGLLNAYIMQQR